MAAHRFNFSPRTMMEKYASHRDVAGEGFWSCTTCGACTQACPHDVNFHEFMREARSGARRSFPPIETHNGVLRSIRNISSADYVRPNTSSWMTEELRLDNDSDTLLFVGCVPYFDVVFKEFRNDLLEIPRSAVRLLNALGKRPKVLRGERCCGHDAYWLGDDRTFEKLARLNIETIEASGAREVVTFCPECYATLSELYPRRFGKLGFKVRNLTSMLADAVNNNEIRLEGEENLTFQDPCRFSKHLGIVNEPRTILSMMGEVREMERSKEGSACCGTACWVNCDESAKTWQMERLKEAVETDADRLVTACPKCLIHLSCADAHHGADLKKRLPVTDIHVLAASRMKSISSPSSSSL